LLPVPPFDDRRWALFLQPKGRGIIRWVPRSKPIGACFELIVLGALAMAAEHVAVAGPGGGGRVILIFDPSAKF